MAASVPVLPVTSVIPFSKNLRLELIILDKREVTETSDGRRVCQCLVADGSGSIQLALWDRQIDALEVADIINITGGSAALYKDQLSIYCSSAGTISRTGSFTKVFAETPNVSTWTWKKDPVSKQFIRAF